MLAIWTVGAAGGCALSHDAPDRVSRLPSPKMSPDSVVLQVAVVHVAPDRKELETALWQQVDEQHLPNELRRRLRENGFRCAVTGTPLPESLRDILDVEDAELRGGPETAARRNHQGTWRERIQCRAGRRYKIVTTPVRDRIDVMTKQEGVVRGQTCRQAHCEFALRAFPQGDGSVRVQLTPEVHYGAAKQRYIGDSHGFILQSRQDRLAFQKLRIDTILWPGQVVILSCTPEIAGLGRHFFVEPDTPDPRPRLLLIRLAQTQLDDLFDAGQVLAPIATPMD